MLGALYVVARLLAFIGVHSQGFPDTGTYEHVAAAPLLSEDFLAGWRAPTLPLLYKVLPTDGLRVAAQLALSIGCWLFLAGVFASTLSDRRMRVAGFAAVLIFSLSPEILMWDPMLITESIAISLTAALVATWILLLKAPTGPRVALMLATAAAWALVRDPHPFVLLLLAGIAAASLLVGHQRWMRGLAVAGLLAISVAGMLSSSVGFPRWLYPLQNLVMVRISPDPEKLAYFEDAGMPLTPRLIEDFRIYRETGKDLFGPPTSPGGGDVGAFQVWLREKGRHTYSHYLLTHPGYVAKAFGRFDRVLLFPHVGSYASEGGPWRFPVFPDVLYPRNAWLPLVYFAIALALAITAAARAGPRLSWVVPTVLIVLSIPFALLVYHGDIDLDRHGVIDSLFFRLGTLLLFLMALDSLLTARGSNARFASQN